MLCQYLLYSKVTQLHISLSIRTYSVAKNPPAMQELQEIQV